MSGVDMDMDSQFNGSVGSVVGVSFRCSQGCWEICQHRQASF